MYKLINALFSQRLKQSVSSTITSTNLRRFMEKVRGSTHELFWYPPISLVFERGMPVKGNRVLDIGYFHGFSTTWLMIATEADRVHAVDIKSDSASLMHNLLHSVNPNAKGFPLQASVTGLPYKDSIFDTVLCRSVLQYVDMGKAIIEMRRVLKPQGKCFIIANLDDNIFVRLHRKIAGSKRFAPFGTIHGYVSRNMLDQWMREGWCVFHKEFHIVTPLLFPLIDCMPFRLVNRILFFTGMLADELLQKTCPLLNRFAWFAFIEIRK
jgi:ubiquinone/menaquinone biosynthesis C-methylase UbiE